MPKRKREEKWLEFKEALLSFVGREGHSCVPQKHIEGTYRLGQSVRHIRSRGQYVKGHPERKVWLDDLGFDWKSTNTKSSTAASWQRFKSALTKFSEREKHCLVPTKHVEKWKEMNKDGTVIEIKYNLGEHVSAVRNSLQFVKENEERMKWLQDVGFIWIVDRHRVNKHKDTIEFFNMKAETKKRRLCDDDSEEKTEGEALGQISKYEDLNLKLE